MRGALGLFLFAVCASGAHAATTLSPDSAKPVTREVFKAPMRELPTPYAPNAMRLVPPAGKPGDKPVDTAFGAYQRGQYTTAFREATKRIAADAKDAAAMTLLGELYNQGLGIKQDPVKAAEWYRLAAAQGDVHAMASLGLMSIDGRGGAKDMKAGRQWLEKAARQGGRYGGLQPRTDLAGYWHRAGQARAATLFHKAAEGEIGAAQHDLGVLYLQGRGVPKDASQAAEWFRRAADNGDLAGEVEFAILLFNGTGLPKDEARAARYFLHAAARGNAIAQNRAARLFVVGRGVQKNMVEAAAWNLAASAQGLSDGWLDDNLKALTPNERSRAEALAAERANVK